MSSGATQLGRGLYVHSESSKRVCGELLQKALPLAPWSGFCFLIQGHLYLQADAGWWTHEGSQMVLKTPFIPCIQVSKWSQFGGVTFLQLGID